MNTALLIIDAQVSFTSRPFWDQRLADCWIDKQQTLLDATARAGLPIVAIFHTAPESGGPFDPVNGQIRPLGELSFTPTVSLTKTAHNAFTDTGLDRLLRQRNITRLLISGIRTEQCCETTARVASDLGYDVDFISDATLTFPMTRDGRTYSAEAIRAHTELALEGRFARILTVSTVCSALERGIDELERDRVG
ncbi:isochorismatase family protein [Larsenimonas suaedae]|uniref:Isochorismatase family protein n=1 Tax=Larsenimonas suaedae TaxID=1851019 RepID=A0ABU1GZZ9_9GAMM|nr:isochorismatase family protein [Larsenimonas suaedae]MCM2972883.1 isochorismatase family protein [Larsenimonas suaedae]MDR5896982.1 isochorismatase family protein [Larsenimonas suaedae]